MIKSDELTDTNQLEDHNERALASATSSSSQIISKKGANKRRPNEKKPIPNVRFDQHNHFPKVSEAATKCKKENCHKKTFIYCTKCKNHLCFVKGRNCFTNFHYSEDSDNNLVVKNDVNSRETRPNLTIRFDKQCHFPILTSKEVRCKNEECNKKTCVICVKCKVHLCLVDNRNCFFKFHHSSENLVDS